MAAQLSSRQRGNTAQEPQTLRPRPGGLGIKLRRQWDKCARRVQGHRPHSAAPSREGERPWGPGAGTVLSTRGNAVQLATSGSHTPSRVKTIGLAGEQEMPPSSLTRAQVFQRCELRDVNSGRRLRDGLQGAWALPAWQPHRTPPCTPSPTLLHSPGAEAWLVPSDESLNVCKAREVLL